MPLQLKPKFVEMLSKDPVLQGKVAKSANTGLEVPRNWALHGRHHKMIRYDVLMAIKEHTQINSVDDLVQEEPVVAKSNPIAALKSNA